MENAQMYKHQNKQSQKIAYGVQTEKNALYVDMDTTSKMDNVK
jgi:hypothetical protein